MSDRSNPWVIPTPMPRVDAALRGVEPRVPVTTLPPDPEPLGIFRGFLLGVFVALGLTFGSALGVILGLHAIKAAFS